MLELIKFCTTITFVESLCPNSLLLCSIMLKSDGRQLPWHSYNIIHRPWYKLVTHRGLVSTFLTPPLACSQIKCPWSDSINNPLWTVAKYALKPFMADAVVARPWMRCQGHVSHGTSWLHTSVRSLCFLHHLGPVALGSVNRVETCTWVCNLYLIQRSNF